MVKKVFMEKNKLFTGKMNLELKKRIMNICWSVCFVLYLCFSLLPVIFTLWLKMHPPLNPTFIF